MTELKNNEITVDGLMQKIRMEVAKRHNLSGKTEPQPPAIAEINGLNLHFHHIETLLNNAESYAGVPAAFPEKLNRFPYNLSKGLQKFALKIYGFLFKKQRVVNYSLSQALRESLALNRQLIDQVNGLQNQLSQVYDRFAVTDQQLHQVSDRFAVTDQQLRQASDRLTNTDGRLSELSNWLTNTDGRLSELGDYLGATNGRIAELGNWLTNTDGRLSELGNWLTNTDARLTELDCNLGATNGQLAELGDRLTGTEGQLTEMGDRVIDIDERHLRNDSYLKNDLSQQKRLIALFLEEARKRLPEPFSQEQLQTFINEDQHLLDALYVAFEDRFRGSREEILNRLKVYLPLIAQAKTGTPEFPILDLGCGRGEWLELLRETGYAARGIDISKVMLEQCRTRGLEVEQGDASSYLQRLPDGSLGAVTGFHIIEHLPLAILIKLFDEVLRVLKPGGLIIFETPNPQNVLVGSGDFYRDPTHLNPIHPDTISYIAELKGFINAESYFFAEKEKGVELVASSKQKFEKFDTYVTISRDFALIGYKP